MQYTIDHNGVAIELPKFTFDIDDKIGKISNDKTSTFKTIAKKKYEFVESLIGTELTEEVIGSFKDCDPNDITIIYDLIVAAYAEPVRAYNEEKIKEMLNMDQFDELLELMEKTEKISGKNPITDSSSRPIFQRVV